jgi:signal transduction histidine kinase/CheY-like chemotaxis protein
VSRKIHFIYVAYLILYVLSWAFPRIAEPVEAYGMLALVITPAIVVVQRGLFRSRFWQGVACAHLMWGIGQVLWITGNQHGIGFGSQLQDSMYWLFKLFILGAILYRPFCRGTDLTRRLHLVDTIVAVSIIAYYIGYFFILPSVVEHNSATFYDSVADVLLNCGLAVTAIVVARQARTSQWAASYRMIATGLSVYTMASISDMFNVVYTDFFWCGAFWSMAVAVGSAPPADAETADTVIKPYRYGLSMLLIGTISLFHAAVALFGRGTHQLNDSRVLLTLAEVVLLTALLHYRHRSTVHESELRSDQLEVTVNSLRQPIYIVDGDYNIVLANEFFHHDFKTDEPCYTAVFGRTHPCEWCELRASRAFSRSVTIRESSYQLEFAPMPAHYGKGGVELLVDVTDERKRQQQVIQTERMASLGRMIAGTAHELNNPLAIVLGNAQLLRDENGLGSQGRQMVESILSASERARDIVHTFLTLSRPRDADNEAVDLGGVIRSVNHLKKAELTSYGISLDLHIPQRLRMMGRHTLLQEVFLNLIDNARDAIRLAGRPQGSIIISGRNDDGRVRVDVFDNGSGISREDLGRVFDPFFSTKQVGQGTGLGLSVVHAIVADHKGTIQVESDGNSFTRFCLDFPAVAGDSVATMPAERGTVALRILVVDDEPEMLTILKQSLSRAGHHVECTSTGKRALQLLAMSKFDVLLLDMHLPEMDGKSIVRRLEAMHPPISVRAIVITGDTMSDDITTFAETHALPIVKKPVNFSELHQLLQENVPVN